MVLIYFLEEKGKTLLRKQVSQQCEEIGFNLGINLGVINLPTEGPPVTPLPSWVLRNWSELVCSVASVLPEMN